METETAIFKTREDALNDLKYQLSKTNILVISCNYFYDQMNEDHNVTIHYYKS